MQVPDRVSLRSLQQGGVKKGGGVRSLGSGGVKRLRLLLSRLSCRPYLSSGEWRSLQHSRVGSVTQPRSGTRRAFRRVAAVHNAVSFVWNAVSGGQFGYCSCASFLQQYSHCITRIQPQESVNFGSAHGRGRLEPQEWAIFCE